MLRRLLIAPVGQQIQQVIWRLCRRLEACHGQTRYWEVQTSSSEMSFTQIDASLQGVLLDGIQALEISVRPQSAGRLQPFCSLWFDRWRIAVDDWHVILHSLDVCCAAGVANLQEWCQSLLQSRHSTSSVGLKVYKPTTPGIY